MPQLRGLLYFTFIVISLPGEGQLGRGPWAILNLLPSLNPCFVQLLFKNDVHFRLEPPTMTTGQLPTLINLYIYCTSGNEYV